MYDGIKTIIIIIYIYIHYQIQKMLNTLKNTTSNNNIMSFALFFPFSLHKNYYYINRTAFKYMLPYQPSATRNFCGVKNFQIS